MNDRMREDAVRRNALESAAKKARRDAGLEFLPESQDRTLGIEGVARRNKLEPDRPAPRLTRN